MATKPIKKNAKKKNGYEAPRPIKLDTILTDTTKKQWKIGKSIGIGGFGEIYSACDASSSLKNINDYPYVVKIEPHNNGPLFVEMHFYMRNCKKEDINMFMKVHKLKNLGVPLFLGSGSEDIDNMKHRFLVMPRYGSDIWKIFIEQQRKFPLHTVYRLGWQLINALEFIHNCTYVHMDLKGANILLGFGKGGDEQVYLLDYGLACHYNTKEYKIDHKKAHNGTIEYTSRDSHNGVATMRGDIEILAYNLIEWSGAVLPWTVDAKLLQEPAKVQKMKENFMKTLDKSLKSLFNPQSVPPHLYTFMKYLETMKHDTQPDYNKIREIFEAGLKELKKSNSGSLEFSTLLSKTDNSAGGVKSPLKRIHASASEKKSRKKRTPHVIVSASSDDESENEAISRSKRIRRPAKYVETKSDDDDEMVRKGPSTIKENITKNPILAKEKSSEILLKSKSGSSKKTIKLNLDLNISVDSDVVIKVNRKDKIKKNNNEKKEDDGNIEKNQAGYYKGKFAKSK